jgi:hypothetical protein
MSIEKFLMNKGIAKSKGQAQGIMILIIIACVLFMVLNSRDSRPEPVVEQPIDEFGNPIAEPTDFPGEEFPV